MACCRLGLCLLFGRESRVLLHVVQDPPSSQAKLPLYTEEQLEQFTNPELCEILTIYQEPLGKRVKADLISRIQVRNCCV